MGVGKVLFVVVLAGFAGLILGSLESADASQSVQSEAGASKRLLQNWEAVRPSSSRRLLTDSGVTIVIKKNPPTPSPPPPSVIIIEKSSSDSSSSDSKVVKIVKSAPSPPPPSKHLFSKFPFFP